MKKNSVSSLKIIKKVDHLKHVYRLRVTLQDVEPKVYRILLVPGAFHLGQLHMLIQMSFGWNNSHLHQFIIRTKTYIDYNFDDGDITGRPMFDETMCILGSNLDIGQKFIYEYDFGDNWAHTIEVLDIEKPVKGLQYPICIEGKNACPPDDCGGPHGYEELKQSLVSSNAKIRDSILVYVGGQFDPYACDPNRLNRDMIWRYDWSI